MPKQTESQKIVNEGLRDLGVIGDKSDYAKQLKGVLEITVTKARQAGKREAESEHLAKTRSKATGGNEEGLQLLSKVFETASDIKMGDQHPKFAAFCGGAEKLKSSHFDAIANLEKWCDERYDECEVAGG